jgi:transposase
MAPF